MIANLKKRLLKHRNNITIPTPRIYHTFFHTTATTTPAANTIIATSRFIMNTATTNYDPLESTKDYEEIQAVTTALIKVDPLKIEDYTLQPAVNLLKNGDVVAFPTETVYGLGANALDPNAVRKIFLTKKRPQDNPLIVHICDMKMLNLVVSEIPDKAQPLMKNFWPGPLTLLFKKSQLVPNSVVCDQPTVAVRMPSHPVALRLISLCGVPLAAPSANLSGKPSPTTASHVYEDLNGRCPCIIDGGPAQGGVESTVVDVTKGLILRPGVITLEQLQQCYPDIRNYSKADDGDLSDKPPTPGLKYRHYSPKASVVVLEGTNLKKMEETIIQLWTQSKGHKFGIIHTQPQITIPHSMLLDENVHIIKLGTDQKVPSEPPIAFFPTSSPSTQQVNMKEVAKGLFAALRELDSHGVETILMEGVDEREEGLAIMNRIRKAASNIIQI